MIYPKNSNRMDWEIEIAFVIGKRARYVDEKEAMDYVAGYTICNDVSERRFQMKRNGQWFKGKAAETFGPLGPWLVTPDEIPDPHNLAMELKVNGEDEAKGLDLDHELLDPVSRRLHHRVLRARAGRRGDDGHATGGRLGREAAGSICKAGDVMELGSNVSERNARPWCRSRLRSPRCGFPTLPSSRTALT